MLTNSEGNHGEDVKEYYFYLDSTPTLSYAKMLYKYPQAAFPYDQILQENRRRSKPVVRVRVDGHRDRVSECKVPCHDSAVFLPSFGFSSRSASERLIMHPGCLRSSPVACCRWR